MPARLSPVSASAAVPCLGLPKPALHAVAWLLLKPQLRRQSSYKTGGTHGKQLTGAWPRCVAGRQGQRRAVSCSNGTGGLPIQAEKGWQGDWRKGFGRHRLEQLQAGENSGMLGERGVGGFRRPGMWQQRGHPCHASKFANIGICGAAHAQGRASRGRRVMFRGVQ